ncbi:hypothetical protein WMF26_01400 [Sorangium sp. So ce185]|uniref:hypothetical protein n=1 Tax=Sorangium sp. So ce185 TaxID=3133287 RepID=UPI003F5F2C67
MRHEDDPARFHAALLDAVLAHAPLTAERVDRQWAILSSPDATARFIASHA